MSFPNQEVISPFIAPGVAESLDLITEKRLSIMMLTMLAGCEDGRTYAQIALNLECPHVYVASQQGMVINTGEYLGRAGLLDITAPPLGGFESQRRARIREDKVADVLPLIAALQGSQLQSNVPLSRLLARPAKPTNMPVASASLTIFNTIFELGSFRNQPGNEHEVTYRQAISKLIKRNVLVEDNDQCTVNPNYSLTAKRLVATVKEVRVDDDAVPDAITHLQKLRTSKQPDYLGHLLAMTYRDKS